MKRDIAERLAATSADDLRLAEVRQVILTFLRELAHCPVCDNTGRILYREEVRDPQRGGTFIPAGINAPCPSCGGKKLDPEFVAWHCFRENTEEHCRSAQKQGNGDREKHAECGLRVMIKLPDADVTGGQRPR